MKYIHSCFIILLACLSLYLSFESYLRAEQGFLSAISDEAGLFLYLMPGAGVSSAFITLAIFLLKRAVRDFKEW
jgi:hypothetical protein